MANPEHLAKLKEGVGDWNRWREGNPEIRPDLRGANLGEWNLSWANLDSANLLLTMLVQADLREANLRGAKLVEADLRVANLARANLSEAKLRGVKLQATNLCGTDLTGADLTEARLGQTVFGDTTLSGTKGLVSCRHQEPSILDHRTIALSPELPLVFLRGCGLPDELIDYLPSLLGSAIEFYSCFISYSMKDQAFAERVHADLQNKGVRCWFAPHDIQGGKKIHAQIDEAIRVYDRLLLILSEHSMGSEWVETEIAHARQKQLGQKRQVLFPVRLVDFEMIRQWKCFDADTGKDSAREIREYFIPDFSNWKDHDAYQRAFERLLKDLKAEERDRADSLADGRSGPT